MPLARQHPENCDCCVRPLPAQQGLHELDFLKSACSAAKSGNIEKLRKCISLNRDCVNSDGAGGALPLSAALLHTYKPQT